MASGITEEMKILNRMFRWRAIEPRETRERDRSLPGKKRVKARRDARRRG